MMVLLQGFPQRKQSGDFTGTSIACTATVHVHVYMYMYVYKAQKERLMVTLNTTALWGRPCVAYMSCMSLNVL